MSSSGDPTSRLADRTVVRLALIPAGAVALGVCCRAVLERATGASLPYVTFVPCILAAALLGGTLAGLISLGGLLVVSAFWLHPTSLVRTASPAAGLALFAGLSAVMVIFADWANRLRARARAAALRSRGSEERLRIALSAGRMGTWDWDVPTGRVTWSDGLEQIHGRPPGTFKGTFEDAISDVHPEDRARLTAAVNDAVARRVDYHVEYRILPADGRVRWLEARGGLSCDPAGNPLRMTGVCSDVTDLKAAQHQLADRRTELETILRHIPDVVCRCDREHRYTFVSDNMTAVTGNPPAMLLGKTNAEIGFPASLCELANATAERVFMTGQPGDIQFDLAVPKGALEFEARCVPEFDQAGGVISVLWVTRDVTRHRVAERRLLEAERAARAEAERANRVKDQFLAALSHELRTPLTPVLLSVSMLESHEALPADARADVIAIRRNVELEARLIDDLLDLTRIARGKIQYDFQTVDVHLLIRSALSICCTDGKLEVEADLAAPHHYVNGDAARLQQVFWNLLNNAWKFCPAGGRLIVRSAQVSADGVERVRIVVEDTGPGIPPELLPRVFDAFEQGDAVRARRFGGLGLGLAISKALVAAHGGKITATSPGDGQGAQFVVELPTVAVSDANGSSPPAENGESAIGLRPLKVLLVEDHPMTLSVLTKILTKLGHEVVGAASVAQGLEAAQSKGPYDLLISDLGLPDGTGHELMSQLRADYGMRGIALSGYGMDEDIRRSRKAGFDDHIVKPVDIQRLQAVMARVVAVAASPVT